jgi:omega-6 fatty acid desaturase (delta-12 desaturase)
VRVAAHQDRRPSREELQYGDQVSIETRAALRAAIEPFEHPSIARACWQLVSSLGFFIATLALMYWSLGVSYWLTLTLALPASGFLVRTFIVQHDCGHGSFFGSPRANDIVGTVCSVFTLAPYQNWRRQHSQHHANWNNLDRREHGADIYTGCLTVNEYQSLSPLRRLLYRLPRHPLPAHLIFPPLLFLLLYRFPFDTPRKWTAERRSVWLTNIAIVFCVLLLDACLGFQAVMMVQLPIVAITTISGVWLFSVQHRFETARWRRAPEWSFQAAALTGSSYLKLPRLAAMDDGKHRLPPYPSSVAANPELSPGGLLPRRRDPARGDSAEPANGTARLHADPVGRSREQACPVQGRRPGPALVRSRCGFGARVAVI